MTHGYLTGWPVVDVKKGFVDRGDCTYVLPPGSVGTQLWNLHQGGGFFKFATVGVVATSCTESYFSVRIRYFLRLGSWHSKLPSGHEKIEFLSSLDLKERTTSFAAAHL